jgi:hypothetical protein
LWVLAFWMFMYLRLMGSVWWQNCFVGAWC